VRVTFVGHATVVFERSGVRVLTDPVLRPRVWHLRRFVPLDETPVRDVDVVLISHMHPDHLDYPSLARVRRDGVVVVPRGAGDAVRRKTGHEVLEVAAGETVDARGVSVRATHAMHKPGRHPLARRVRPIGYVVDDAVYFAGDTGVFDGMRALGPLELAFLPVWGWGPWLGRDHLDPARAAEAAALVRPAIAVPIHWGAYRSVGVRRGEATWPPHVFADLVRAQTPQVDVRVLAPGETAELGRG
jgi:L-ascorbate metabolism protein UlaG (beta-lactamase superfamily)